jgi:hypothetical protein
MKNESLPAENPDLLREGRAAQFIGVSQMTLIRKRRNGEVSFYQVGNRRLYSKENHLLPYLKSCEQKAKGSL